jgi:hypothetical protein
MNSHCRIGRIIPTDKGLACPEFMAWLLRLPRLDWISTRFNEVK